MSLDRVGKLGGFLNLGVPCWGVPIIRIMVLPTVPWPRAPLEVVSELWRIANTKDSSIYWGSISGFPYFGKLALKLHECLRVVQAGLSVPYSVGRTCNPPGYRPM